MWIEEIIPIEQVPKERIEVIDAQWAKVMWGDILYGYIQTICLDVPVPSCGRPNPRGPALLCKMPPGHESADIPCIWVYDVPGKYTRIVKVTSRDPREEETAVPPSAC